MNIASLKGDSKCWSMAMPVEGEVYNITKASYSAPLLNI